MNELKKTKSNPKSKPPRGGRWFWAEHKFFDEAAWVLTPTAVAIYMLLRRYSTPKGYAYPSMKTIASKMKTSSKTVMRHIQELEKFGFIEREKRERRRGGQWLYNTYYIMEPERWLIPNRGTSWHEPEDNLAPG